MKLHLPEILLLSVLSVAVARGAETIVTDADGKTTYTTDGDVKLSAYAPSVTPTASNNFLPSGHVEEFEYDNLTLSDNARLGVFSGESFVQTADRYYGEEQYITNSYILSRPVTYEIAGKPISWSDTYSDILKSATIAPDFKVNGTLSINGSARVDLGGQYRLQKGASGEYDEYTGLIADRVVVDGSLSGYDYNLVTSNLQVNTLHVKGGNVAIHSVYQSGNDYFVYSGASDSKQVSIKRGLEIDGGKTVIGNVQLSNKNAADDTCVVATFGELELVNLRWQSTGILSGKYTADDANVYSSLIKQTGGELVIKGKTASVGGLNINQTGGTMSISTAGTSNHSWHVLSDFGDSNIEQFGDEYTVLNIGGITAYNSKYSSIVKVLGEAGVLYNPLNPDIEYNGKKMELNASVKITQYGAGELNIQQGINLYNTHEKKNSTEVSSIIQKDHVDEATGKVTATTGTINLSGEYKGATFNIDQSAANGTIKLNGTMAAGEVKQTAGTLVISKGAEMSADTVNIGGTLENYGTLKADKITIGAVQASPEPAAIKTMAVLTDDDLVTIAASEVKNYGEIDSDILVLDGGSLTLNDGASVGAVTLEAGANMIVAGDSTTGALTLKGGTITFTEGASITVADGVEVEISKAVVIVVNVAEGALENLREGSTYTLFKTETDDVALADGLTVKFVDTNSNEKTTTVTHKQNGDVIIGAVVPEPATATLSLLALAALAARRRRAA